MRSPTKNDYEINSNNICIFITIYLRLAKEKKKKKMKKRSEVFLKEEEKLKCE